MLNLNHPIRFRSAPAAKVSYIGTHPSRQHRGERMLFVLVTESDGTHVAYYNLNGTHRNGIHSLDLVNVDTTQIATMFKDLNPELAKALKSLWVFEQFGPVLDTLTGLDPKLNRTDIQYYLEEIWGR